MPQTPTATSTTPAPSHSLSTAVITMDTINKCLNKKINKVSGLAINLGRQITQDDLRGTMASVSHVTIDLVGRADYRTSSISGITMAHCVLSGRLCHRDSRDKFQYHKEFNQSKFIDSRIALTAEGIDCVHCDFTRTVLSGDFAPRTSYVHTGSSATAEFWDCQFSNSSLSGNFKRISFSRSTFTDCCFEHGKFTESQWHNTQINRSNVSALTSPRHCHALRQTRSLTGCYVDTFEQAISLLIAAGAEKSNDLDWSKMPLSHEDAKAFFVALHKGHTVTGEGPSETAFHAKLAAATSKVDRAYIREVYQADREINQARHLALNNNLKKCAKGSKNLADLARKALARKSCFIFKKPRDSKTNTVACEIENHIARQQAAATSVATPAP